MGNETFYGDGLNGVQLYTEWVKGLRGTSYMMRSERSCLDNRALLNRDIP